MNNARKLIHALVVFSLILQGLLPVMPVAAQPLRPIEKNDATSQNTADESGSLNESRLASFANSDFWGDINGDRVIDAHDLRSLATVWNCATGDECYESSYDRDGDGDIDALDLAFLGNDYDVAPPLLTITTPLDEATIGGVSVLVEGTVSDAHQITEVTVNGVAATLTPSDDTFMVTVPLEGGNQTLMAVAYDELGMSSATSVLVFVDQDGPFLTVDAPRHRQAVYTLRPTIDISYSDFYTSTNPATLQVLLTDENGSVSDVTGELTITDEGASGTLAADLVAESSYTLTASLADLLGNVTTINSTFYVAPENTTPPEEPEDAGWVSGVIYDSVTCQEGTLEPLACEGLAGALVTLERVDQQALQQARTARAQELANTEEEAGHRPGPNQVTGITTPVEGTIVTGPDGFFAFPVPETGHYWLRVEKENYTYGQREAQILRSRSTPVNEIYLTPLDANHILCDAAGCDLTSSDDMMRVQIPAGAISDSQTVDVSATFFEQVDYLPSGALPAGTWETYAFNLGGDSEFEFTEPITVSVKNTLGFAPNTPMPLGFWNQNIQAWEHAGVGQVDASGEWLVFNTTHFSTYDHNDPVTLEEAELEMKEETKKNNPCGGKKSGYSEVSLRSGELQQELILPPMVGLADAPTLHYNSSRVNPGEIIEVNLSLDPRPGVELGDYVQAELFIEGQKTDNFTFPAPDLEEGGEVGHFRYLWDGRDAQGNRLPPGVYDYAIHVQLPYRAQYYFSLDGRFGGPPDYANGATGVFVDAWNDDWLYGTVTLDADPGSAFGMGWTVDEWQQLYENEAGRIMISDGCDVDEFYFAGKDLLAGEPQLALGEEMVLPDLRTPTPTSGRVGEGARGRVVEPTNSSTELTSVQPTNRQTNQPTNDSTELTSVQPTNPQTNLPAVATPQPTNPQTNPPTNHLRNGDGAMGRNGEMATPDAPRPLAPSPPRPLVYEHLAANTNVAGTIITHTTWVITDSPYILTDEVVVAAGIMLTVSPGVVVQGNNNIGLRVEGHIHAQGTITEPITFTSFTNSAPNQWKGLIFDGGTGDLRHTTVRYGGDANDFYPNPSSGSNIALRNGELYLESSAILDQDAVFSSGLDYGLYIENSQVVVSDTLFSGNGDTNEDFALYATDDTVITLTNNIFQDNSGYALRLSSSNLHRLTDNLFANNGIQRLLLGTGTLADHVTLTPLSGIDTYEMEGSLTVPASVTLTISEGVTTLWSDNTHLLVEGHLSALGTSDEPILFTSLANSGPSQWKGLIFDGGTGDLRHTTVRYGGDQNDFYPNPNSGSNIALRNGELYLESSAILDQDAVFSNDLDYGLYIENSQVVVSDTLFSGNGDTNQDFALYATDDTVITLTNNIFQDNNGYALRLSPSHLHRLTDNLFANNGTQRLLLGVGTLADHVTLSPLSGLDTYEMEDSLTVPASVTLTISEGVTTLWSDNTHLLVEGHLSALGTSDQPILFTSLLNSAPNQWKGLIFDGGTGDLRHTTVRYGGDQNEFYPGSGGNIALRNGELYLESSAILDQDAVFFNALDYGLYIENSQVVVSDTLFSGNGDTNQDFALYVTDGSTLTLTGNIFQNNAGYPLRLPVNLLDEAQNNIFLNNETSRILVPGGDLMTPLTMPSYEGLSGYDFEGNVTVVAGNQLTVTPGVTLFWNGGLTVDGHLVAIGTAAEPVTFTSRTNTGAGQWNGITLNDGSMGEFEYATIRYATTALNVNNARAEPRYVSITDNSSNGIRLSGAQTQFSVHGSDLSNNNAYGLLNQSGVEIDARYNWWGDITGPFHPDTNSTGLGSRVSDDVIFEPWFEEDIRAIGIFNRTATDTSVLTYDNDSQTYTRYYPDGREVHFNPDGTHDYTLDSNGNRTTYRYATTRATGLPLLTAIEITPAGESTPRWAWNLAYQNGYLSTITDSAGRVTSFEVDANGNLVRLIPADATSELSFSYDDAHRITHKRDELGDLTTYHYDQYGRIQQIQLPPREVANPVTGDVVMFDEVHHFTPTDVGYQLINNLEAGSPLTPTEPLITSTMLVDQVVVGGHQENFQTDAFGFVTKQTDGLGRTTIQQRNSAGWVIREITPEGNCTEYERNDLGNILKQEKMPAAQCDLPAEERDPAQIQTTTFRYDDARFPWLLTQETTPLSYTTSYEYDDAGNLIVETLPEVMTADGLVTPVRSYDYDQLGNMIRQTDERGIATCYTYTDGSETELFAEGVPPVPSLLTREERDCDGLGQWIVYREFDASGNPQIIERPGDSGEIRQEQRGYDAYGRLISETNAIGITTLYQYAASWTSIEQERANKLVRQVQDYTPDGTSGRNIVTEYSYDSRGNRLSERTVDPQHGLVMQRRFFYDEDNNQVMAQDAEGNLTRSVYDAAGQRTQIINANGDVFEFTFTGEGRLATENDGTTIIRHSYDGFGRRISQTIDDGGLNLTIHYGYDSEDRLVQLETPDGAIVHYDYNSQDQRTSEMQLVSGQPITRSFAYDAGGLLVRRIDRRGVVIEYVYDSLEREVRLIEDVGGLNLTTLFSYSLADNLITTEEPRGTLTSYDYDDQNRLIRKVEDANGLALETTYSYDTLDNQTTMTDPEGITTLSEYNAFNRLTRQVADWGGLNAETRYSYDNNLNQIAMTDDNGNTTQYRYDALNRLIETEYADSSLVQTAYNPDNTVAYRINQAGERVDYSYDSGKRLIEKSYPDGSTQTFTHDGVGRRTSATQTMNGHTTTIEWTYNEAGSITSHNQSVDGINWNTTYDYDYLAGEKTVTYPSGAQVTHILEARNRLGQVLRDGVLVTDYNYDDLAGTLTLAHANGVSNLIETDALRRTTRISSSLADYRYGYDAASNRTYRQRFHESGQPADVYQYNGLYQLTNVWYDADSTNPDAITNYQSEQDYQLDSLGNRLEVTEDGNSQLYLPNDGTQLTNPMNRYQQVDATPFSYDSKGNLLSDGLNSYSYDYHNRQIGISGAGGTAEYVYNALGQRVAKIVDGQTTYYILNIRHQVIEERDVNNQLLSRYTYGNGVDEPLTMERNGQSYTYHADAQGSITEISNQAGTLVEQYNYDVYGNPAIFDSTGNPLASSAIGNPYLFTARRYDPESGNYHYRARIYAPWLGRFLQMDPSGYVDGANLYQYVSSNPATYVDPYGLNQRRLEQLQEAVDAIREIQGDSELAGKFVAALADGNEEARAELLEQGIEHVVEQIAGQLGGGAVATEILLEALRFGSAIGNWVGEQVAAINCSGARGACQTTRHRGRGQYTAQHIRTGRSVQCLVPCRGRRRILARCRVPVPGGPFGLLPSTRDVWVEVR